MTDQNNIKKPGQVKRIFRWFFLAVKWLFVVLLGLLLIAGLYFQAPPKVLTLVAIILATLTIIPKPARKWIWLTFAVIVIALIIWVFLPEVDGDWRPYTFDEELAALEAKRAIPDEQNAATIYNKLLETYDANDFYPEFMDDDLDCLTLSGPWSSEEYPQLAQWIDGHSHTIELLLEACEKDQCRFPIYADPTDFMKSLEHRNLGRRWRSLLVRSANNDVFEERLDGAIKKYLAILKMAKHQYQQPTVIDLLVGIAIEASAYPKIKRSVVTCDVTDEHLELIDNDLSGFDHDWSSCWHKIVEHEKLYSKNVVGMYYEINTRGNIRLSRNPTSAMIAQVEIMGIPLNYLLSSRNYKFDLKKAGTIISWLFMPSTPQKAAEIIDDCYRKHRKQKELVMTPELSIKLNYTGFTERAAAIALRDEVIHDFYNRLVSEWQGTRLVIAVRRYKNEHGHWPDNLDDVKYLAPEELFVDPTNNDSYVYRLTEDGFTLYSKGKNNIDENGDSRTKKPDGSRTDDLLIWPTESRKVKQEVKTQN